MRYCSIWNPACGESLLSDRLLVQSFGQPNLGNKKNVFNELLYIILSSKTPPKRYQEVYHSLRCAYPRAESFVGADPHFIAQVISRAGLQNRKAHAIVTIADRLYQEFGRVTLAPLKHMESREAEQFLETLPEVSRKTARCVLMYALDRPVFPVDSHCFRISKRLGWISKNTPLSKKVAETLQEGVPKKLRKSLHIGMVVLGRRYCLPREPKCKGCPINKFCSTN